MRSLLLLPLLLAAAMPLTSQAQPSQAQTRHAQPVPASSGDDPYLWLEEVSSPRAMGWVEAENAKTVTRLQKDPRYAQLEAEALRLGSDKDRIPAASFRNGALYNFWTDAEHPRGLFRKTTLESYRTASPDWTPVIDIDALNKAEGKSWVWHGANCLAPEQRLCLISLSNGGEDADEVREFDLSTGRWVEGGFHLPRGKHRIAWEDQDTLLVASEWTPGDLTPSGYPYIVKRLKRGQPLAAAVEVYRGGKDDGGYGVSPTVIIRPDGERLALVDRPLDTFRRETYVLTPSGAKRLAIPLKAGVQELIAGRVLIKLDEDWTTGGETFPAGALVQTDLAALKADPAHLKARIVYRPGPRETLEGASATRDKLLVTTLDNVRGRAWVYTPTANGGWTHARMDLPDNLTVGLSATDDLTDRAFLSTAGFLTPSTYILADAATGRLEPVKALPPKFDGSRDVVEQLEATSSDGTKVPYFVVHRKDAPLDGSTPTLMTAYGGFQASMTPSYSSTRGKLWLERGGAFVLANIRGGGEFGPAWHEAGIGTKRQIIYDDFAAVAKDLFKRGITSPRRLGIQGGSNGGLLMGVEFTQHPELWNAVSIEVPLLDMIRISKIAAGASWQGEYGDVNADPAVMAFWRKTSPYQNLRTGVTYPEPFIWTTTKDDRVGPQHARKFAARLSEMKLPYMYFENTEGGHGSGADFRQQAKVTALTMTYFSQKLMD